MNQDQEVPATATDLARLVMRKIKHAIYRYAGELEIPLEDVEKP